jgi:hypothetical protein
VSLWLDEEMRVEAFIAEMTGGGPGEYRGANILLVHVDGEEWEESLVRYAAGVIRENLQHPRTMRVDVSRGPVRT